MASQTPKDVVRFHESVSPTTDAKRSANRVRVMLLVLGSIASSVSLIMINKALMQNFGFKYVFTLSFLHFSVTAIVLRAVSIGLGVFELKSLPLRENLFIAAAGVGSISFMNLSLETNSVGFYQTTKLAVIPTVLLIKYFVFSESVTMKIFSSLVIVLVGVGIATITDVEVNQLGSIFGVCAVVSTAQFQIWQGTKQRAYSVNGTQITASVTPYQAVMALILAFIYDFPGDESILNYRFLPGAIVLLIFSCLGAIAVNLVTYALLGKTSAITYQIVGHLKTALVLLGGFIFFASAMTANEAIKNLTGIAIAMVGVVLYGHLKLRASEGQPDVCDACCGS